MQRARWIAVAASFACRFAAFRMRKFQFAIGWIRSRDG
jgi:hypothetical protein